MCIRDRQKVDAFSFINIPVERQARPLFAKAPIERDVADNITGYDGRVYVIVLDDQHTHPLRSQRLKAAARQFVLRYMGANDTAAIVYTSGRSDVAQEFTNSQRRLLAAVDKFMGRKLRSSTLERLDEEQRTRGTRHKEPCQQRGDGRGEDNATEPCTTTERYKKHERFGARSAAALCGFRSAQVIDRRIRLRGVGRCN